MINIINKRAKMGLFLALLIAGISFFAINGTECSKKGLQVTVVNSSGQTAVSLPGTPAIMTAEVVSQTQINFSWANVDNETGYKIERSQDGLAYILISTTDANILLYSDAGLSANTLYYYKVCAFNDQGNSGYTGVSATTLPNPPNIPESLSAEALSQSQIALTWTDVTSETGYKIERSSASASGPWSWSITRTSDTVNYTDDGLFANTTYYYKVCAYNTGGNSDYTLPASATTLPEPVMPPNSPLTMAAVADSSFQTSLSWVNVDNETGYKIMRKFGLAGTYSQISTTGMDIVIYNDVSVTPTNTYYYQVCATNEGGDSGYSPEANATTPAEPLNAPTALTVSAVSSTRISLTWTDVSGETGYKVERKLGISGIYSEITTTGSDVVTYSDNSVTPSNTYYYQVRATNGSGDSGYSPEANATTPAEPLNAPTALTASAVFSTQISLIWTDISGETGYKIERKFGVSGIYVQIATAGLDIITYNDITVTPSNTYYYQVRATNGIGDSGYSPEANATTPAPSPPNAPTGLTIANGKYSGLKLTWTDNSSDETRFYIDRSINGGDWTVGFAFVNANIKTYADTTATDEFTLYYYRVRAWNSYGYSSYTDVVSAWGYIGIIEK